MFRYKDVTIREFRREDIPLKIEWVNNPENSRFLHYDLPLEYENTLAWFENNRGRKDRFDATIEFEGEAVGLCGLLHIDYQNLKAEDYMLVGDSRFKRKGIATKAGALNALYCFEILKLHKLYAFVEVGNPSLDLDLKRGFHVEGYLHQSLRRGDRFVDRYVLGMTRQSLIIPGEVYWEED